MKYKIHNQPHCINEGHTLGNTAPVTPFPSLCFHFPIVLLLSFTPITLATVGS